MSVCVVKKFQPKSPEGNWPLTLPPPLKIDRPLKILKFLRLPYLMSSSDCLLGLEDDCSESPFRGLDLNKSQTPQIIIPSYGNYLGGGHSVITCKHRVFLWMRRRVWKGVHSVGGRVLENILTFFTSWILFWSGRPQKVKNKTNLEHGDQLEMGFKRNMRKYQWISK